MARVPTAESAEDGSLVDPRAPRFGQAITATLLLAGIAFRQPAAVYAVTVVLGLSAASGWRIDLYGTLWRGVAPLVGQPDEREPAAPHRFAKLLGAVGTVLASVVLVWGTPVVGYAIAGGVAVAAGFAAATDVCIGCRLYRHVGFARKIGVV